MNVGVEARLAAIMVATRIRMRHTDTTTITPMGTTSTRLKAAKVRTKRPIEAKVTLQVALNRVELKNLLILQNLNACV